MDDYTGQELQVLAIIMERWIQKIYIDFQKKYELSKEQQAALDTYQEFMIEALQNGSEEEEEE